MAERDGLPSEVYVQPGESCLVAQPAVLRTVLGSCVGITFCVVRLRVGALCHPMLPRCSAARSGNMSAVAGRRYVDFAIRDMARQLDELGAQRSEVEVKLFGGGDVLVTIGSSSRDTVGKLNSEVALKVLEEEGFTVSACSLGGTSGVQIRFETATGEVMLRRLAAETSERERQPSRKVHRCGRRRL